jgi:hypothetical protein
MWGCPFFQFGNIAPEETPCNRGCYARTGGAGKQSRILKSTMTTMTSGGELFVVYAIFFLLMTMAVWVMTGEKDRFFVLLQFDCVFR